MKKNTHPEYKETVFEDSATGSRFICGSTYKTKESTKIDGKEYPLCRLSVSSYSHPFFTGSKALVDSEGRIDKFKKRYATPAKRDGGKDGSPKDGSPKDANSKEKKKA